MKLLKEGEPSRIELLRQLFERVFGVCLFVLVCPRDCPWLLAELVRYFYVCWSTIWRNWLIDEGLRTVHPTKIFIHFFFWVTSCRFYETQLCFWHRGSSCLVARISGCSGWFCLQTLTAARVWHRLCANFEKQLKMYLHFQVATKMTLYLHSAVTWGIKLLLLLLLLSSAVTSFSGIGLWRQNT